MTASPFPPSSSASKATAEPPLDDYFDRLDAAFSSLGIASTAPPAPKAEPTLASPTPAPGSSLEVDWFNAAPAPGAPVEGWDLPAAGRAAPPPGDLSLSYGSTQTDLSAADALIAAPPPATPAPVVDHHPAALGSAEPTQSDVDRWAAPVPADAEPIVSTHVDPPAPAAADVAPPSEAPAVVPPVVPAPLVPMPVPAPVERVPVDHAPVVSARQPLAAVSRPVPSVPAAAMPSLGDAFAALLAAETNDPSSPMPQWPAAAAALAPAPESQAPARAPEITDAMLDDVVRRVLERMSDTVVRDATSRIVSAIAERLVREEIERIKASVK
jgi:hypothetical protein